MKKVLLLLLFLFLSSNAYSLTPKELIFLLEKNNLDLALTKVQVKSSRYEYLSSKRSFFPTLSLNAEVQEFYPYQTFFKKSWNQNYSFGATASLDLLNFKKSSLISLNEKQLELSKLTVRTVDLDTIYKGLSLLLELKGKELVVDLRKKEVRDSRVILSSAKAKYRKGLSLITDLLKAEANYQKALSDLDEAKLSYEKTFNRLNEFVDYKLKEGDKPEVDLKKAYSLNSLSYYVKKAFSLRPEIKEAEKKVEVAKSQVKIENSSLTPSLSFSASYQRRGTSFFPENNNYSLSLLFSYPVFDSGVTKYKVLSKEELLKGELLNLKKVKNRVKREVIDAYISVKSKERILKSAESFLTYSEKAYQKALKGYNLGVVDIVNLLQTHSAYLDAQLSYINALLDYNLAILSLRKAVGDLYGGVK